MSFVHQTIEQTAEEIINEYRRMFLSCLINITPDMKTPLCIDEYFRREMIELFLQGIRQTVASKKAVPMPIFWVEVKDSRKKVKFGRAWDSIDVPSDVRMIPKNKFEQEPVSQVEDLLGVYCSEPKGMFIWVDKIWRASKYDEKIFRIYLLQVMLHVYAYAYMDEGGKHDDEFLSYYKESSLAEGISLYQLQKIYDPKDIEFLNFIPRQMPYALGNIYKREELLFPAVKKWMNTKQTRILYDKATWWNIIFKYPMLSKEEIDALIAWENS